MKLLNSILAFSVAAVLSAMTLTIAWLGSCGAVYGMDGREWSFSFVETLKNNAFSIIVILFTIAADLTLIGIGIRAWRRGK
ncbi:MAG: hypothetical protein K9N23_12815 [Akkermansiaceae bacterium]|nr:hypothetical protein [Akkermansiaceae bacterium]